ncbi:MAG: SMP-30/gluconolactonase/LRE family protein [Oscillospiraceae bacterium]|nr:SMP-30/gluconolactonase/LRE family protein [Oscillospiraceae bacterium]
MEEFEASALSDEKYRLAESPFYDSRFDRLSWVDILDGKLYQWMDGSLQSFDFGEPIGAAIPLQRSDGFFVAGKSGLWKYENGRKESIFDLRNEYKSYQRSNDAKADPEGRVFFGSVTGDDDHEAGGNLYRFDGNKIVCVQKGTKLSNGMAWSSDHKKFFFSDSLEHAVFTYDYNIKTGEISNRNVLFHISDGVPDGMCIDSRDRLWVAIWDGNRVECRNTSTGELEAIVNVPAAHVSSCCFYGNDLDKLFITTAGDGLQSAFDGRLYECHVGSIGKAPDLAII